MKKELDDKLVETFPIIYRDRYGDMRQTCMVWGFSYSDGWFQLTWDLSEKLEEIAKAQPKPKDGEEDCRLKAVQMKEKFGTIRAYFNYSSPEVDAIIDEAEEKLAIPLLNKTPAEVKPDPKNVPRV